MRPELPSHGVNFWQRWLLTLLKPKVGIPIIVIGALIAAPLVYRGWHTAGLPEIGDPFDLEGFAEVALEANALGDYQAAVAAKLPMNDADLAAYESTVANGWEFATPEVRQWLEDNRRALDLWRAGTQKPHAMFYPPREATFNLLLPITQELREFARLAALEGLRLEAEGELDTAWQIHRASFRSSRHSGMHGCMVERLVGISIHGLVADGIVRWANDPRVTSEQLRTAIQEIESDYAMTPAPTMCFKVEYVMETNLLKHGDLAKVASMLGSGGDPRQLRVMYFLKNEPHLSRLVAQHVYANLLSQSVSAN